LIVPLRGERHQGARENLWNVRKPSANLRTKCAPEIELELELELEFFPSIDFLEIANVGKSIIAEPGQQQQSPRDGTGLEFDRGIDVEPVCWGLGWSSIE
jgi:hypothetical protein